MRIKVCGIRDSASMVALQSMGIDYIGHIFYDRSPRYVGHSADEGIENARLPGIRRVGVFVNHDVRTISQKVDQYGLDCVQLHGDEPPELCVEVRTLCPVIRAIAVNDRDDVRATSQYLGAVDLFLFDTRTDKYGGSGKKFNWDFLDAYDGNVPFLLSGGLGPGDAEDIRRFKHPAFCGVDLNSGFETAPAVKDMAKIKSFINDLSS